jgi:hypothetical protein
MLTCMRLRRFTFNVEVRAGLAVRIARSTND